MTIYYIQIPVSDMAVFAPRYLELTGEQIQDNPPLNAGETHCLIGTARMTADASDTLMDEFPEVIIGDSPPSGWLPKEEVPS